jgi:selenium metabolism protein YedF
MGEKGIEKTNLTSRSGPLKLVMEDVTMQEIDCRGKACPQPVLLAKQVLEQGGEERFILIVDNPSACENVERFARAQGCAVKVERGEQDFRVHIQRGKQEEMGPRPSERGEAKKVVVYINSNLVGVGDEALGAILMRSFLKTLVDLRPKPNRLILINSGVRLASEGSEVVETLRALSQQGVEVHACGTCLDFYGLKEKLKVGVVSNMYDIAQSLLEADRLIRP